VAAGPAVDEAPAIAAVATPDVTKPAVRTPAAKAPDVTKPAVATPAPAEATAADVGGGLLAPDVQAPAPRVVALAPLPEADCETAAPAAPPETAADAARGLVALVKRLAHLDAALPSLEVDEFGRDPAFEARVRPLLDWMYRRYFRVAPHGLDKLPRSGPLILVANRAGAIPWDAAMVGVAAARAGREVRPLLEDAVFHFPFLGVLVNRLGAVRACPENAERLLAAAGAVAVFPEGAGGFAKPFRDRYRVQRFGRGGFVRLALKTGATIVPVAVVGSEETYPLLGRLPARFLGVPFLPITPTWPWLGAAGLWPLPSKWTIEFGDPVDLRGLGPEDANDDAKAMRVAERVRTTVQAMLDARLAERTAIFAERR
jgi:1-acyl-sn-glycerol-3-phosphate acyltransferase